MNEIEVWALDDSTRPAERLKRTVSAKSEDWLEAELVKEPDMLMQDLRLVGRQTPVAGGYLDLLGVDKEGRLVVFELKREKLTREAVTQVIDYASSLEAMSSGELGQHIAERSGHNGIDKIGDFEEWYWERFQQDISKTVRMVLVGLGADENARRMVDFLARRGLDMALLTFYGFEIDKKTLLAKQVDVPPPDKPIQELDERAKALGIGDFWTDVTDNFRKIGPRSEVPTNDGLTFIYPQPLQLPGPDGGGPVNVRSAYSVRLQKGGKIRISFFPAAIHVCKADFQNHESIPFSKTPSANASPTQQASDVWFCVLNKPQWEKHEVALTNLASAVHRKWSKKLQEANRA